MSELMLLPAHVLARPKRRGHAAQPGGGPAAETCGSCRHRESIAGGRKSFSKCALAKPNWTRGAGSDIARKDPACAFWKGTDA